MKGLFSIEEDKIVSYGITYELLSEEDNVYVIPDDFDFGKYKYASITPGMFNPDGFTLISNEEIST